jgi:hypothetical protein
MTPSGAQVGHEREVSWPLRGEEGLRIAPLARGDLSSTPSAKPRGGGVMMETGGTPVLRPPPAGKLCPHRASRLRLRFSFLRGWASTAQPETDRHCRRPQLQLAHCQGRSGPVGTRNLATPISQPRRRTRVPPGAYAAPGSRQKARGSIGFPGARSSNLPAFTGLGNPANPQTGMSALRRREHGQFAQARNPDATSAPEQTGRPRCRPRNWSGLWTVCFNSPNPRPDKSDRPDARGTRCPRARQNAPSNAGQAWPRSIAARAQTRSIAALADPGGMSTASCVPATVLILPSLCLRAAWPTSLPPPNSAAPGAVRARSLAPAGSPLRLRFSFFRACASTASLAQSHRASPTRLGGRTRGPRDPPETKRRRKPEALGPDHGTAGATPGTQQMRRAVSDNKHCACVPHHDKPLAQEWSWRGTNYFLTADSPDRHRYGEMSFAQCGVV